MKIILLLTILIFSFQGYTKSPHHSSHRGHKSYKNLLSKRPVAHIKLDKRKCHSPCTITFDAGKSKAFRGKKITKYHFDFGDGNYVTTDKPVVKHTYHGNPKRHKRKTSFRASLIVTDDSGKSSRKSRKKVKVYGKTEVVNEAPISSYSFAPLEPKINEVVTLTSTATDDQGIVSYEWETSDGRVLTGETIELSFATEGWNKVTHRVYDAQGLTDEFSSVITVIPDIQNPSLRMEFSGILTDSFNPLDLNVTAKAINGLLADDVTLLEISLNEYSISLNGVNFTTQEVTFPLKAKDGKNTLSVSGIDSNGDTFSSSIDFYAGSKILQVEVPVPGASGTLEIYPRDNDDFKANYDFLNGVAQVTNAPSIELVVDALTDANNFGYSIAQKEDQVVQIEMLPNREPSTVDNDDFSQGMDGWTIVGGSPLVVDKIVKNEVVPNDLNLRVYTDETEDVSISRSFLSKESNRSVQVDFNYVGSPNEELHVVLRNQTTGEVVHRIFEGKDSSDLTEFFDVSKKVVIISDEAGDIIHLDIFKKSKPVAVSFIKSFFNVLISEAIAQSGPQINRYVDINSINYPRRNILTRSEKGRSGFEARSWYFEDKKGCTSEDANYITNTLYVTSDELNQLSVGPLPSYVTSDMYSIYTNFAYGQYDKDNKFKESDFNRANLYIVQRGHGISRYSSLFSLTSAFKEEEEVPSPFKKFSFVPAEISLFSTNSNLTLVLEIEDNGNIYYEELRAPLQPLQWYTGKSVYGCTDTLVGGAKWATADTVNSLEAIFKLTDRKEFSINDISKLNGGTFKPHKEHKFGQDVDYSTTGFADGYVAAARAPADIHKVLSDANQLTNVRSVYVTTYKEFDDNEDNKIDRKLTGKVDKVIRARCTDNNYLFKNVFEHKPDHNTHGHIRFSQGVMKGPIGKEFFPGFHPFFLPRLEERSISLKTHNYNPSALQSFIWEIRRNGETVEVIDSNWDKDPNPVGIISETNSDLSSVKYTFPPEGGDYSISLVAVDFENRCMTKSFDIKIPSSTTGEEFEEPAFCDGEWQTYRGNEIVNEVSGHTHLAGAIVSENTIFEAGRFYVDVEEVLICGNSEIRDSFTSFEGCPEGQSKAECASIYMKGIVDAENTVFDARNGKILIAGLNEPFLGLPLVAPTDLSNGIGLDETETSLTDTTIAPSNDLSVVLFNVDIFDGARIHESALIQQSIVSNASIGGQSTVSGATVFGFVGEDLTQTSINVTGKSFVEGLVHSWGEMDIISSIVTKNANVGGRALVSGSFVDGQIGGINEAPLRRVEVQGSTVYFGSTISQGAHVQKGAVIGLIGEEELLGSLVSGNALVSDGARVNGTSYVHDASLTGNSRFVDSSAIVNIINGIPGEGTISISDNASIHQSYIDTYSGNISIKENAQIYNSGVRENAKMSGSAILSGLSSIQGSVELNGSVHVTNGCHLFYGIWSDGTITPGEGSPCGNDPSQGTVLMASRTIASTDEVSSLNEQDVIISKPKKVKKRHQKVLRGIKKHEDLLKSKMRRSHKGIKKKPKTLEEIKGLEKRSQEYKERVQTEARLRTAR